MYKKISGICIEGKFFGDESNLKFFSDENHRLSIVYGKNGSGKSTIAEAFKKLKRNDIGDFKKIALFNYSGSPINLAEEDLDNIYVFDEDFIEENIKFQENGLNTIILFGKHINLDNQIEQVKKHIEEYSKDQQNQKKICDEYNSPSNIISPYYHYEEIKKILKSPGGWAEVDSKIKGNKTNSAVNDTVINEIIRISPSKSLVELQKEFNEQFNIFSQIYEDIEVYNDEIRKIDLDDDIDKRILQLLSKKINKPELSEREKLIFYTVSSGYQKLVEEARVSFSSEKNLQFCPYCYQVVSEEYKLQLLESINKVLNREVEKHREDLEQILIEQVIFDKHKYTKLDNEQLEKVIIAINKCNEMIETYNIKIKEKISNIYTPIIIDNLDLKEYISIANKELEKLEILRIKYNTAHKEKEKLKTHLIYLNKHIARLKIDDSLKRYNNQLRQKEIEDNKYSGILRKLEYKKIELQQLQLKKKNINIALKFINDSLEYIYYCKGRLTLEAKDDVYYLKSYGNPVKPQEVSTAERNIIALCYYFTQIFNNLDEEDLYKNKYFLIIDDPISSIDVENRIGILSFLKLHLQKILLGNKESRVVVFSHDLGTIYDLQRIADEIKKIGKQSFNSDNTKFCLWELKNKELYEFKWNSRHEYTTLVEMVFRYANGESIDANDLVIGNVIRRVLEAFSTFEYKKSIEEISYNKKITSLLPNQNYVEYFENLMYRLVLHGESHYEESVKSLVNMNFFNSITPVEKVRTARDVLCLMYLLNRLHIEFHLANIPGAVEQIASWCQSIGARESVTV